MHSFLVRPSLKLSAGLRRLVVFIAVWLPLGMAAVWTALDEHARFVAAQHAVASAAAEAARAEAELVHVRLMRQFSALGIAAEGVVGPAQPGALDAQTARMLQRFAQSNRELFALNIQSADGNRILWSTLRQPSAPITPAHAFTPLPTDPDCLLGRNSFAPRAQAALLTMRHRVLDASGHVRFYVGSPYRINDLLRTTAVSPFMLLVRDQRDGSLIGAVHDGRVVHLASAPAAHEVRVNVADLPLTVAAQWTPAMVRRVYRGDFALRVGARGLILATLFAVGMTMSALLRRRARQARRIERLSGFNAMLAEVNQALAQAEDERGLMQAVCELAVRHTGLRLVWIGRPDPGGRFAFPAAAGPAIGYMDDLFISTDPMIPEGQGSVGRVWREGQAYFNSGFGQKRYLLPWSERAARQGLKASAVMPIRRRDAVWAVMALYAPENNFFDVDLRPVLLGLADDVSHGMDLVELRQANKALTDHADAGVVLVRNRRIEYANARFVQMFGFKDAAQVRGIGTRSLYADDASYVRAGSAYRDLGPGSIARMQALHYVRQDGSTLPCDVVGVGLADGQSVWTLTDVGQREEQAARLLRLSTMNALLAAANQAAATATDARALFAAVCQAGVDRAGMLLAWVGQPLQDGSFAVVAAEGRARAYLDQTSINIDDDRPGGWGPTGRAWRDGAPVFVQRYDSSDSGRVWVQAARRYGFGAFAALPLRRGLAVQAVLTVYFREPDILDEPTRGLLLELAAAVDRGLQMLWQRLRIQQLQRLYRALLAEGDVVLQTRNVEEMMARTCSKLVRGTIFHAVWIGRPGEDGLFRVLARAGSGAELVDELRISVNDEGPLVARAWREQTLVHYNENLKVQHTSAWLDKLRRHGWASALAAPIRRGGEIWAVLTFVAPEAQAFDPQSIEVCRRVAALLGHGLDELDLKENLRRLQSEEARRARLDSLTGLPNRLALEQHLPQAIARARRQGRALALGMLDLDDFKPINDRFGHEAGDVLLRQLGARLQGQLRATDMIARLGGDEFVIVIEDLEPDQPLVQLEVSLARLHHAVESPFDLGDGRRAEVGMSMGVALYPSDDTEPDALLRRADAGMYAAKAHKFDRTRWWRLGVSQADAVTLEAPFDPLGAEAPRMLALIQPHLDGVAHAFANDFYATLVAQPDTGAVLACLSEDEFARLKRMQAEHLRFLLCPATSCEAIEARARAIGRVHALTGVSGAWMTQAMGLYRELLRQHLESLAYAARERYRALRAADARLQLDVQTELDAMQSVVDVYHANPARPLPSSGANWTSLVQAELDTLGALPGVRACQLMRPRSDGVFAIEFSSGPAAEAMERIALTDGLQPRLDARDGSGQGLIPQAWFGESIERSDAYGLDARTSVWHAELAALGIRSLVAIPVHGGQGPEFVLVLQGAFPHQFSSGWAQTFCASLQNRWGQITRLTQQQSTLLPVAQAAEYRRLFHSGALHMDMQPVVDLITGRPVKLEALARLRRADGSLVPPGQFLPALRDTDLDALFRQGLDVSLAQLRALGDQGIHVGLSINLAPSTLVHPDCPAWVGEALRRFGITPARLTLELLETQEFDEARRDQAIAGLRRLGVQLAIDDLGAGYSSLKRLASLAFDVIKVDQSLIRDVAADPVKTLSLVRTIVQIGRDFEREVVVEGLESRPIIEAVVRLGAVYGQGYGLSRPLAPETVSAWMHAWTWETVGTMEIRSFLGALAYHWGWMHEESGAERGAFPDCPMQAFLEARGLTHHAAAQWHRAAHEAIDDATRKASSAAFIAWLVEQVREECGPDASQA